MLLLSKALIFIYLLMNALKETLKLSESATLHSKTQGIHFLFFCKLISEVLKEKILEIFLYPINNTVITLS